LGRRIESRQMSGDSRHASDARARYTRDTSRSPKSHRVRSPRLFIEERKREKTDGDHAPNRDKSTLDSLEIAGSCSIFHAARVPSREGRGTRAASYLTLVVVTLTPNVTATRSSSAQWPTLESKIAPAKGGTYTRKVRKLARRVSALVRAD